jgi:hypothetical protein
VTVQSIRRIGIGDREHVRTQMLSVLIVTNENLITQLQGAFIAAESLKMFCRTQLNLARLSDEQKKAYLALMLANPNHQALSIAIDPILYRRAAGTCDIVLIARGEFTAPEITASILTEWESHKGRFTNGNFAFLGQEDNENPVP